MDQETKQTDQADVPVQVPCIGGCGKTRTTQEAFANREMDTGFNKLAGDELVDWVCHECFEHGHELILAERFHLLGSCGTASVNHLNEGGGSK